MNVFKLATIAIVFISLISCSSSEDEYTAIQDDTTSFAVNLPSTPFNYANIQLPQHYTNNNFPPQFPFQSAAIQQDNTPANNPTTNDGATLGRVLFYDKTLSANGTVSCSSCHKQDSGFSDPSVLSSGFNGGSTRRHSMGLANARFYSSGRFFWDERAATLEAQVLQPFQDPVEMGLTLNELESKVESRNFYPQLFENAFGDNAITSDRISRALAQFVRSLVSVTSKYDLARANVQTPLENFPDFTAQENQGKLLFFTTRQTSTGAMVNCASCHISEAFLAPIINGPQGATMATNNGLDATSTNDLGVNETTGNPNDIGKFKVPSLKNIGIRAPYMHDGRFATLLDVVNHYSSGVQNHPNLSRPLLDNNGNPIQFEFTEAEKDALVAFLQTLTDNQMMVDEKYSDPF